MKLLLIACLLAPLLARAGYGTNSFFVTLEPKTTNLFSGAIENARTNIECQPAEQDTGGNWGNKFDGLQLSLRFEKSAYRADEQIIATIIYRNTSDNYAMRCRWAYGGDRDFDFAIRDENGNRLRDSFVPQYFPAVTAIWWPPGTQYIYQSNLTERFGLSKPGTYSVLVGRRLPSPAGVKSVVYLYSAPATITITE